MATCLIDVSIDNGYPAGQVFAIEGSPLSTNNSACITQQYIQDNFLIKPLWSITAAEGLQISLSIGLIWGLGFAFRTLGQIMNEPDGSNFKE